MFFIGYNNIFLDKINKDEMRSSRAVLLWACVTSLWMLSGDSEARGSNPVFSIGYRAQRYGNYYSNVYYSYTGGKGYARYSRAYSHNTNLYPTFYNYMFDWFKTGQYKVYKNTPSGSISVCKNYEADENGTYLGIFTCPLPFVPTEHSYCCGVTNAQYCCKFWDVTQNFAAAMLIVLMGVVVVLTAIHITIQLCITKRRADIETRKRKAIRRIGFMRRRGRQASSRSLWDLFDRVHAASNYSEGSTMVEADEDEYESSLQLEVEKNTQIQNGGLSTYTHAEQQHGELNNDAITVTTVFGNLDMKEEGSKASDVLKTSGRSGKINVESGSIGDEQTARTDVNGGYANNAFVHSWGKEINGKRTLRPLRLTSKVKFN